MVYVPEPARSNWEGLTIRISYYVFCRSAVESGRAGRTFSAAAFLP
jgi:hypothetical protein